MQHKIRISNIKRANNMMTQVKVHAKLILLYFWPEIRDLPSVASKAIKEHFAQQFEKDYKATKDIFRKSKISGIISSTLYAAILPVLVVSRFCSSLYEICCKSPRLTRSAVVLTIGLCAPYMHAVGVALQCLEVLSATISSQDQRQISKSANRISGASKIQIEKEINLTKEIISKGEQDMHKTLGVSKETIRQLDLMIPSIKEPALQLIKAGFPTKAIEQILHTPKNLQHETIQSLEKIIASHKELTYEEGMIEHKINKINASMFLTMRAELLKDKKLEVAYQSTIGQAIQEMKALKQNKEQDIVSNTIMYNDIAQKFKDGLELLQTTHNIPRSIQTQLSDILTKQLLNPLAIISKELNMPTIKKAMEINTQNQKILMNISKTASFGKS